MCFSYSISDDLEIITARFSTFHSRKLHARLVLLDNHPRNACFFCSFENFGEILHTESDGTEFEFLVFIGVFVFSHRKHLSGSRLLRSNKVLEVKNGRSSRILFHIFGRIFSNRAYPTNVYFGLEQISGYRSIKLVKNICIGALDLFKLKIMVMVHSLQ